MPFPIPTTRAAIIGAMMSIVGGVTAIVMLWRFRASGSNILAGDEWAVVAVAVIGAFIAGMVVAPGFGRKGWRGWGFALLGAIAATASGAFIGGLILFQTLQEAMICVVMVGTSIVTFPITGLFWLAMMGGMQKLSLILVPEIPADLDLVPGPDNL